MIRSCFPKLRGCFSYNIGSFDKFHTPRIKLYVEKNPPKMNLEQVLKDPATYKTALSNLAHSVNKSDKVILLLNSIQKDMQESFVSYQKGQQVVKLLELVHKQEYTSAQSLDLRFLRIYSIISRKVRNDQNSFFETLCQKYLETGLDLRQFQDLISIVFDHYVYLKSGKRPLKLFEAIEENI